MGWKGEWGQQRTAQNTRCQRLALFFPPRWGRYNFSIPAANAEARVWPGRGTGRRGAPRSLNKNPGGCQREPKENERNRKCAAFPQQKTPPDGRGLVCKRELLLGGDEHARTHGGA